jgi:hypothetical protein
MRKLIVMLAALAVVSFGAAWLATDSKAGTLECSVPHVGSELGAPEAGSTLTLVKDHYQKKRCKGYECYYCDKDCHDDCYCKGDKSCHDESCCHGDHEYWKCKKECKDTNCHWEDCHSDNVH